MDQQRDSLNNEYERSTIVHKRQLRVLPYSENSCKILSLVCTCKVECRPTQPLIPAWTLGTFNGINKIFKEKSIISQIINESTQKRWIDLR